MGVKENPNPLAKIERSLSALSDALEAKWETRLREATTEIVDQLVLKLNAQFGPAMLEIEERITADVERRLGAIRQAIDEALEDDEAEEDEPTNNHNHETKEDH